MEQVGQESGKQTVLRRARREDIHALIPLTSGPMAGRVRALRRLLKTLVADVYVRCSDKEIHGCVAVVYRRSLREGGLTATIDLLFCAEEGAAASLAAAAMQQALLDILDEEEEVDMDAIEEDISISKKSTSDALYGVWPQEEKT